MVSLVENKKGLHNNEVLEKYTSGIVLSGPEVKSVKAGRINLTGSYVDFIINQKTQKAEPWLLNCHISPYSKAGYSQKNYDPTRARKLLLNKKEISYLIGKANEKGLTILPVSVYIKNNLIKMDIAVAKGMKKIDKRDKIKKRDFERIKQRMLKQ